MLLVISLTLLMVAYSNYYIIYTFYIFSSATLIRITIYCLTFVTFTIQLQVLLAMCRNYTEYDAQILTH